MSVRSAAPLKLASLAPGEKAARSVVDLAERRRQQAQRRRVSVIVLRVLVAVGILGGSQLGARLGVLATFFWAQPSDIAATLCRWPPEGSEPVSLCQQVL